MKRYILKYILVDEDVRTSKFLIWKNQIYKNVSMFCNKHPDQWTFLIPEGELGGKHVKWEETKAVRKFIYLKNTNELIKEIVEETPQLKENDEFTEDELNNLKLEN